MHLDPELQAAGRRAANQTVAAPPVAELHLRAQQQQLAKRRTTLAAGVLVALMVAGLPFALNVRSTPTIQEVAVTGTEQFAAASQPETPGSGVSGVGSARAQDALSQSAAQDADEQDPDEQESGAPDPDEPESGQPESGQPESEQTAFVLGSGDHTLSVRIESGSAAVSAAADAEARADEIVDFSGTTIWIRDEDGRTIVAALVDPDEFVEVSSDGHEIEWLIDVLRDGGIDRGNWSLFFDDFDPEHDDPGSKDWLNLEFDFDNDDGFTLDSDRLDRLEGLREFVEREFIEGESIDGTPEFEKFLESDIAGLQELLQELEGELPDLEQLLEGSFADGADVWQDYFNGCVSITIDGNLDFEFPVDCSTG